MLKRREECDTYPTHICRRHISRDSSEKRLNIRSYQPTLWLSSVVDVATLSESSLYLIFSLAISATVMSTDVIQADGTHFPSF